MKTQTKYVSQCCKAEMSIHSYGPTNYYICYECQKDCDRILNPKWKEPKKKEKQLSYCCKAPLESASYGNSTVEYVCGKCYRLTDIYVKPKKKEKSVLKEFNKMVGKYWSGGEAVMPGEPQDLSKEQKLLKIVTWLFKNDIFAEVDEIEREEFINLLEEVL